MGSLHLDQQRPERNQSLNPDLKRSHQMSRDILSEYGKDTSQPQAEKASCGGVLPGKTGDVNDYQRPLGPKNINDTKGPGLHGKNHGVTNGPDRRSTHSGKPGIGGTN